VRNVLDDRYLVVTDIERCQLDLETLSLRKSVESGDTYIIF